MATTFAGSKYPKLPPLSSLNDNADNYEDDDKDGTGEGDEDEDEEDSAESGSTSSFSLQECINEFRARRTRRVSAKSDRDMPTAAGEEYTKTEAATTAPAADAHLINQNLCNKAQERKGKPCKNGFCYCFTSDSGDCASTAPPPRDWHVRQHKRSRRPEINKVGFLPTQQQSKFSAQQSQRQAQQHQHQQRRQRAPSPPQKQQTVARPLTAVSSLRAVGDDAPLIHIIQELRDNCVISEVRVNREKLPTGKSCSKVATCCATSTKRKAPQPKPQRSECIEYKPTAPALSNISEHETPLEEYHEMDDNEPTASLAGDSQVTSKSRRSSRRSSSGAGGRLLQKRLSNGMVNFKTRDAQQPPPKPPRRSTQSLDEKFSLSSLTSTTPSVRDAERVLDEFLRKHGVQVPSAAAKSQKSKRKSYPLAEMEKPQRADMHLATCPSLSDIERVVESKRGVHYAKNIQMERRKNTVSDKPMKEIMIGWAEPKINDMLNYDAGKLSQIKTQPPEPAPQVASSNIGWQMPVGHKISLDTVDGVSENLAVNMGQKQTPIKYPRVSNNNNSSSQKFIWGEQWRQLSPWSGNKKRSGLGNKSKKFLNNSKKKILRFVSPKKSNQQQREREGREQPTPRLCTVGVQTSSTSQLQLDLLQSQSPPGSYHSPVQTTPSGTTTISTRLHQQYKESSEQEPYFDFERKVKPPSPPKKLPRAQRARKLNFQSESTLNTNTTTTAAPTTYRSFQKDIDQDVTHNKMSYLLSSIRAKLEASDDRASRTFRECSNREPTNVAFDCIDGPMPRRPMRQRQQVHEREPIYSEIEEDCMRFRGSPQFEVRTEAQLEVSNTPTPSPAATPTRSATATVSELTACSSSSSPAPLPDLSALYAKVQKANKTPTKPMPSAPTVAQPRPLGQFLQESLLNGSFFQFMPLPDEPSSDTSYTASTMRSVNPISEQATLPMHHSLNNINEQHSPPKKNRNLSKSDLSLQRSEVFLENLCRSEIVLDRDDNMRLEKVQNTSAAALNADDDDVSYDMPHELYDEYAIQGTNISASIYGSAQLEPPPPSSDNQSTPKKPNQRFTTKPSRTLSIDINDGPTASSSSVCRNVSLSCPTTPQQDKQQPMAMADGKPSHSSLGELAPRGYNESNNMLSVSTLARYRLLKDAVRRSYRKGKDFLLAEKQRLTQSLNISRDQSNQTEGDLDSSSYYASFQLDSLLNESMTTREQLAQAVSICRQMPELEISAEMVEAERLLLFSSLRKKTLPVPASEMSLAARRQSQCFLIDGLRLPVKADVSQDMFFNYYYICTVECEGRIRSTQSIECQNGAAVFRDCGLEFYSEGPAEALELRCQIFMLRLRKVSTLSLEPPKTLLKRGSGSLGSGCSNSSSQSEQIVSRFRLHASFTLRAADLMPYELVMSGTQSSDKIWLRTSRTWQLPLTPHTKSSNLMPQIALSGRVELRLPKLQHAGYLNVQDADPKKQHNWNRRWCTLDGLCLCVWQHEHNLSEQPPLLALQLERCQHEQLDVAPRELCARARSFLLQCIDSQAFFAADTQPELAEWLCQLNKALAFARRWLSAS